jgi:mono/diheme cytochrome c family protein
MRMVSTVAGWATLVFLALAGCDLPGRPKAGPEVPRPEEVLGFEMLYGANCAGCHGAHGHSGGAMDLANPEYEALIRCAR